MELGEVDLEAARECLGEAEAMTAIDELAQAIANAATENTPIGHTGRASASIEATGATLEDGVATAYVYSSDPFWHLIEYGSVNNDVYRPITRAAQDAATFEDAR